MKVFLKKDIEGVGLACEIISVSSGYARNYLFPKKLAVEITEANRNVFEKRVRVIENRKETVSSKTSILAQKINDIKLVVKRRLHDDNRLYGAIKAAEIVDLLSEKGIAVGKSQVELDKSIKTTGLHKITIKLSSKLKPQLVVKVIGQ